VPYPKAPRLDQDSSIEPKRLDRGTTSWGAAPNVGRVATPSKVCCPDVPAWVKKRNNVTGMRIDGLCPRMLVVVAPEATPAEVIEARHSAARFRYDMINREVVTCKLGTGTAILTKSARTPAHCTTECPRDPAHTTRSSAFPRRMRMVSHSRRRDLSSRRSAGVRRPELFPATSSSARACFARDNRCVGPNASRRFLRLRRRHCCALTITA
jgi:hypothetical protein